MSGWVLDLARNAYLSNILFELAIWAKLLTRREINYRTLTICVPIYGRDGMKNTLDILHGMKSTLAEKHTCIAWSPKQHAYLLFGFTLARANARMLINAASKRSSAKNAVRTSRSRSP